MRISSHPSAFRSLVACLCLLAGLGPAGPSVFGDATLPPVKDLASRLKVELPELALPAEGVTNSATYLRSLAPLVLTGAPPATVPNVPALARTRVYRGQSAYLRVSGVESTLATALASALADLSGTNSIAGVVLDLRFASGSDFAAAAAAAGVFANRPLDPLRLGTSSFPIPVPEAPFALPVIVLVHQETRGAAEALAAAVRATSRRSLVIGSPTAGEARSYRRVELVGGLEVSIAREALQLPDGRPFPVSGLQPDLGVQVSREEESRYYTNEFGHPAEGRLARDAVAFRLNEAELVRRMRGTGGRDRRGMVSPSLPGNEEDAQTEQAVQDPVLARALDLISGVSNLASEGISGGSTGDSR